MIDLDFHPYSEMFPMLEGEQFDALVESIRELGVLDPVILYDGKILDGRNRYIAALEAGRKVPFMAFGNINKYSYVDIEYDEDGVKHTFAYIYADDESDDPQYIQAYYAGEACPFELLTIKNFQRRNLTVDQRAVIHARLLALDAERQEVESNTAAAGGL